MRLTVHLNKSWGLWYETRLYFHNDIARPHIWHLIAFTYSNYTLVSQSTMHLLNEFHRPPRLLKMSEGCTKMSESAPAGIGTRKVVRSVTTPRPPQRWQVCWYAINELVHRGITTCSIVLPRPSQTWHLDSIKMK